MSAPFRGGGGGGQRGGERSRLPHDGLGWGLVPGMIPSSGSLQSSPQTGHLGSESFQFVEMLGGESVQPGATF